MIGLLVMVMIDGGVRVIVMAKDGRLIEQMIISSTYMVVFRWRSRILTWFELVGR